MNKQKEIKKSIIILKEEIDKQRQEGKYPYRLFECLECLEALLEEKDD